MYSISVFCYQSQIKKEDESLSPAAYKQAKAKLLEIEEVLTPHCPPEFVQNVIKGLIEKCNTTGSYDILDEALENHRNNVNRFYLWGGNEG
jgi:hypothetical protein